MSNAVDDEKKGQPEYKGLELVLYNYGRSMSKLWFVPVIFSVAFLVVGFIGLSMVKVNDDRMDQIWASNNGEQATHMKYYHDWFDSELWKSNIGFQIFVDKRAVKEAHGVGKGGDVLTQDHMQEIMDQTELFYETEITDADGVTFNGIDFCDRVTLGPDSDGPGYTYETDCATLKAAGIKCTQGEELSKRQKRRAAVWGLATAVGASEVLAAAPADPSKTTVAIFPAVPSWLCLGKAPPFPGSAGSKWDTETECASPEKVGAAYAMTGGTCPQCKTVECQVAYTEAWSYVNIWAGAIGITSCSKTHEADAYAAYKALKCPKLWEMGMSDPDSDKFKTLAAELHGAWNAELLPGLFDHPVHGVIPFTYSYDQIFGPKLVLADMCAALATGAEFPIAPGTYIPSGLPSFKLPCLMPSTTKCFKGASSQTLDPVFATLIDKLAPSRDSGTDMSRAAYALLAPLAPSGFSYKPSIPDTAEELKEIFNQPKWDRLANDTDLNDNTIMGTANMVGAQVPAVVLAAIAATGVTKEMMLASMGNAYAFDADLPIPNPCPDGQVPAYMAPECDNRDLGLGLIGDATQCRAGADGVSIAEDPSVFQFTSALDFRLTDAYRMKTRRWKCVSPEPVLRMNYGCQEFMTSVTYDLHWLFGATKTTTDDGDWSPLEAAEFSVNLMLFATPQSMVQRFSKIKPGMTPKEAEALMDKFLYEFELGTNRLKTEHVEAVVSVVRTQDVMDESTGLPTGLLGASIALLVLLIVSAFVRPGKPYHSRLTVIGLGFIVVLLTTAAAHGFIALVGLKFNVTMTQALPFFGLGLGIDDLFILVRYFDLIGVKRIAKMEVHETIATLLGSGGVSVTLTSVCNAVSFFCGAFLPVQGVADFCLGAAIVCLCNWVIMMTLVPVLLRIEASRIVARAQIDADAAQKQEDPKTTWETVVENFFSKTWVPLLAMKPVLASVCVVGVAFTAAMIAIGHGGPDGFSPSDIVSPDSEFGLHDAYARFFAHQNQLPLDIIFEDIDFPNQQREVAELWAGLSDLDFTRPYFTLPWFTQFANFVREVSDGVYTSGITTSTEDALGCPISGAAAFDVDAVFLPTFHPMCGKSGSNIARELEDGSANPAWTEACCWSQLEQIEFITAVRTAEAQGNVHPQKAFEMAMKPNPYHCPFDTSYTHPVWLKHGMVDPKCWYTFVSFLDSPELLTSNAMLKNFEQPFFPSDAYGPDERMPNPFAAADQINFKANPTSSVKTDPYRKQGYLVKQAKGACAPTFDVNGMPNMAALYLPGCALDLMAEQAPTVSAPFKFLYATMNLVTPAGSIGTRAHQKSIDTLWKLVEDSPLKGKVFPKSDVATYSDAFRGLRGTFFTALLVDALVIFVVTLVLLRTFVGALVGTVASLIIVLQIFGVCTFFCEFNFFVSAALLMAVGVSVEFTAHIVAAFFLQGAKIADPVERVASVMREVAPPILLGGISTLMSVLMLGFADIPFIVKYFFGAFVATILVGLLNALVFLPAFLLGIAMVFGSSATSAKVEPEAEKKALGPVDVAAAQPGDAQAVLSVQAVAQAVDGQD